MRLRMLSALAIVIWVGWLWTPTQPQTPRPVFKIEPGKSLPGKEIRNLLETQIDTKEFRKPRTFKEFLNDFRDHLGDKGKDLQIFVNTERFKEENPDGPDVYDTLVVIGPFPKQISAAQLLREGLSKIATQNATYVVRHGMIEITTVEQATLSASPDGWFVDAQTFEGPLATILEDLSESWGVSIVIDQRVQDKAKTVVKARFINPVSMQTVLNITTDMADLRWVRFGDVSGGAVYVTSPTNAAGWKKDMPAIKHATRDVPGFLGAPPPPVNLPGPPPRPIRKRI